METYRAILKGNRLEWTESKPTNLEAEQPVEVTILDTPYDVDATTQGERMAKALERLAASNALADIRDPVAWQREIRKDRPLPGREE
jgi:3-mercaptopyruvate sulfurtransferase SseA